MASKEDILSVCSDRQCQEQHRLLLPNCGCTARWVAAILGLPIADTSVALLRCFRASLLSRRRIWCCAWSQPDSEAQHLFHYALTERGEERLSWYRC